jgi:hypothetical protein
MRFSEPVVTMAHFSSSADVQAVLGCRGEVPGEEVPGPHFEQYIAHFSEYSLGPHGCGL